MSSQPVRFGGFEFECNWRSNGVHFDWTKIIESDADGSTSSEYGGYAIGSKEEAYALGMLLLDRAAPDGAEDWRP